MGQYDGKTNAELQRLLDDRGIDRGGLRRNAEYVEALEATDAQERSPEPAAEDATAAPQEVNAPTAEVPAADEVVTPQEHEEATPVAAVIEHDPAHVGHEHTHAGYPSTDDLAARFRNASSA